ncbi:MAG: DUF3467 domain-containing protein [Bacteroidales bacterium]|nr:DUF3467 domain-containing protein [Bacteroidales bacterium]
MEQKKPTELKIEITPEVANGHYANFAVISHGASEFFLDFVTVAPNMPQAKVQSRIVMTPENAKTLLSALAENVKRYEAIFGEIQPKLPKNRPNNGGDNGALPNPFIKGGNA